MNRAICFYEPREIFAEKLMDYWADHGLSHQIYYYSDEDRWRQDRDKISAELWLLDKRLYTEDFKPPTAGRILWWGEEQDAPETVFKYQSAAVLLRILQGYLGGGAGAGSPGAGTRLVSMYSPIKRSLQTTFGLTLAHILSQKGRTLYINLEGYSGLDQMLKRSFSKDISDFIYYVNQSSGEIPLITQNYVYRLGDVDMLPPVLNPANLQEISEAMWLRMLRLLKESGLYEYILMDVSDFILGTFAILRESNVVFSLTKSDVRAEAKWQQYCSVLEEAGYGDVLEKTRQQELPHITELPGDMGEQAPGEIREIAARAVREAGL